MIRIILLALLVLLLARAFWRVIDGIMEAAGGPPRRRSTPTPVKLVRDPVCGTHVPTATSLSLVDRGVTQYFCSEACRDSYRKRA